MGCLAFGAGGLGDEAGGLLPPPTSGAPMPRMRARHWYSASGSGFGSRHGVFLLSLLLLTANTLRQICEQLHIHPYIKPDLCSLLVP